MSPGQRPCYLAHQRPNPKGTTIPIAGLSPLSRPRTFNCPKIMVQATSSNSVLDPQIADPVVLKVTVELSEHQSELLYVRASTLTTPNGIPRLAAGFCEANRLDRNRVQLPLEQHIRDNIDANLGADYFSSYAGVAARGLARSRSPDRGGSRSPGGGFLYRTPLSGRQHHETDTYVSAMRRSDSAGSGQGRGGHKYAPMTRLSRVLDNMEGGGEVSIASAFQVCEDDILLVEDIV